MTADAEHLEALGRLATLSQDGWALLPHQLRAVEWAVGELARLREVERLAVADMRGEGRGDG